MSASDQLHELQQIHQELQNGFMMMNKYLGWIANNTRPARFHSAREFQMPTQNKWYSFILVKTLRHFIIRVNPQTAVLLIGYGETDNLQETPPIKNYTTVAANSGRVQINAAPPMIFIQSDTNTTTLEIEQWV